MFVKKKIFPLLSNKPEVIDFDNNELFNSINIIKDQILFECFFEVTFRVL